MDRSEIVKKIRKIVFEDIMYMDPVGDDVDLAENHRMDSINTVEIIISIEDEFNIKVEEDMTGLKTVDDFVRVTEKYL